MDRVIRFFFQISNSLASHREKANNYLNIKEENLDFYFWIALVVI
jgi:hypothetical protein